MLMNVSMECILVTTVNVLTASTMRVAIHVLAGQALLESGNGEFCQIIDISIDRFVVI